MTKTDTSREAVERQIVGALKSAKSAHPEIDFASLESSIAKRVLGALKPALTERDALQARADRAGLTELEQIANDEARHAHRELIQRLTERAERAEAGLAIAKDGLSRIDDASNHYALTTTYSEGVLRYAHKSTRNLARATLAQLDVKPHTDDLAVDRFAAAMKAKLAKKRAEGRGGWDDPESCTTAFLSSLLRDHVAKGDPVDVGNFAMMLHQRGSKIDAEPAGVSGQTHREGWEQCKEAAASLVENQHINPESGEITGFARLDAAAIRAMPYPGDSQ